MIKLIRDVDALKEIRKKKIELSNDERYLFFNIAGWTDLNANIPNGWSEDFFCIQGGGRWSKTIIGAIEFRICRSTDEASSVNIFVCPEYLNTGLSLYALALFIEYAVKRFFKISFFVVDKNKRAKKIYDKLCENGARCIGVERKGAVLENGQRADTILYELLSEDFKSNKFFENLLRKAKTQR